MYGPPGWDWEELLAAMALLAIAATMLFGCTTTPETRVETVEVVKPVYVRPEPPDWLLAPLFEPGNVPAAIFTDADDPDAVLGVTRDGLRDFWRAIDRPVDRLEEWEAWATEGDGDE